MSWQVKVQPIETEIKPAVTLSEPLAEWLPQQGQPYEWLLGHTYDGIIWGRLDSNGWQLSTGSIPKADALLELRLFGTTGECYVWRDGTSLKVRTILDGSGDPFDFYDEWQMLWGTDGEDAGNQFTTLWDGSQGMEHTLPLAIDKFDFDGNGRSARLVLRHYVAKDNETGLARVIMSRLHTVTTSKEETNGTEA